MQDQLGRECRGERAQSSGAENEAVEQRPALSGKPQHHRLERRHQRAGGADAHDGATQNEHGKVRPDGEDQHPDRRERHQSALHPARTVTIHHQSEWKLEERGGEEIDRGEKSEICRRPIADRTSSAATAPRSSTDNNWIEKSRLRKAPGWSRRVAKSSSGLGCLSHNSPRGLRLVFSTHSDAKEALRHLRHFEQHVGLVVVTDAPGLQHVDAIRDATGEVGILLGK